MIESVELHNWRCYEHLLLQLEPGVTFIVAPNGVGKSSIIEGARFALYGVEPSRGGHRKADATGETRATVDIKLEGDSTLRVTRALTQRRNAQPITTAELDGTRLDSTELTTLLRSRFRAPIDVLDRLSMIHGSDIVGSAQTLDLRAHLSDFLGVSGLDRALADASELHKEAESDVKRHRAAAEVSREQLTRLQDQAICADADLAECEETLISVQARLSEARSATREAERILDLVTRANERKLKLRALVAELADLVGAVDEPELLPDVLAGVEQRTRSELDANRRRRAELEGRIAASSAQLADLDQASGTCPVCRRPLDAADLATAREAHEAEIEAWIAERDALTDGHLERALDLIARAQRRLTQLGPASDAPSEVPNMDAIRAAEEAVAAEYETTANAAVLARATARQAKEEFETAAGAATALQAVTDAYTRQATLEATIEALTETRASLLRQGIEPLAESLDMHWSQLFRNRPGLSFTGDGGPTRAVGQAALLSSQFSDGERMVAQLLLRLLVLKATTRLPFMWIDEPLEHLDPDARRALALLLTTAPARDSSALRQVVMTTYEEPLVRRLRDAIPNTHVRYVRPAA